MAALACAAVLVPSAAGAATGAATHVTRSKNVIKNGNFEADECSADGSVERTPKKWHAKHTASSVICWADEPGYFPSFDDRGPKKRGSALLAGGPDRASTVVTQHVRVPSGAASYVLAGYLGGFEFQEDATAVTVTWRDASGAAVGTTDIGPVTASDRHNKTGLLKRTAKGAVPAGAVAAVVTVVMSRAEGAYNDGYIDALSLKIATG